MRLIVKTVSVVAGLTAKVVLAFVIVIQAQELHGKLIRHVVSDKVSYIIIPNPINSSSTIGTGSNLMMPSGKVAILTNRHICEDSVDGHVYVMKQDSSVQHRRKVQKMSFDSDLCLVEPLVDDAGLRLAGSVSVGDKVISVGHPGGLPLMASYGEAVGLVEDGIAELITEEEIKAGKCRWKDTRILDDQDDSGKPIKVCVQVTTALLTTCEVVRGSSGSPLLNIYGNVAGIIHASGINNWAYAVPLADIRRFIKNE